MSPYLFLQNVETEIAVPESGMQSRTLWNEDTLKVLGFGFSAGHELAAHTAPMPVVLYFVKGEATLTLGSGAETETKAVTAGSMVHIPARLTHSIVATSPLVMLLLMLKQPAVA